jgi:transcriptional regulator with XRE-family HTH domain
VENQKRYSAEPLTSALRSAREARGLSQRALAARAKIPQSHLSKIETGAVDLQLSSLLELARELDLDVMLVPRKFVPAIEALTRSEERKPPTHQTASWALPELTRIGNAARGLQGTPQASKYLQQIIHAAKALESAEISSRDHQAIRRVADMLAHLKPNSDALPRLRDAAQTLQTLRNVLAHRAAATPAPQRPAYSLNEEDEDA